ncbi:MAG: restriction endonuclease [Candidatus Methanogaster sp.]|uniref:Restriction endonuclease n=1 Tax=Candidatus Methanogaster sp. TaxID=3386292 RepID=A0AC61L4K7_9EURY|nr:MAG: restriction endonuclease [ANME-2 cluster archaeon]
MKENIGPKFLRFVIPVIDVLKKLGGSGKVSEVQDAVIELLDIPENELEETLKSGDSRVRNQIAWARFYLSKSGYLESSRRGVWTLTEKGLKSELNDKDIHSMFKDVQGRFDRSQDVKQINVEYEETIDIYNHRKELLNRLQSLPPEGFERICQRLLRESGFQQVKVTGKTGDGGIDGHGILEINPLVSFKVIFQCKRYQGTVSASQVRDFRGAMMGRADKGIIITTGRFSLDAKGEAVRDGVPPIELVDGEKMIDMFENIELGLIPKTVYEIDDSFFEEFK